MRSSVANGGECKTKFLKNGKRSSALFLVQNRKQQKFICLNDTDQTLGLISADKNEVIKECHRQLYNIIKNRTFSFEEAKNSISNTNFELKNKCLQVFGKRSCSHT